MLNFARNDVSVYDQKTLAKTGATSGGIGCPSAMAMSRNGVLYVAGTCPSAVAVFDASTLKLERTITKGISDPVALTVAP